MPYSPTSDGLSYGPDRSAACTLYGGTAVAQARAPKGQPTLAMVARTRFYSAKGQLLRCARGQRVVFGAGAAGDSSGRGPARMEAGGKSLARARPRLGACPPCRGRRPAARQAAAPLTRLAPPRPPPHRGRAQSAPARGAGADPPT